jgi:glucose/arabinose dehydrogenase
MQNPSSSDRLLDPGQSVPSVANSTNWAERASLQPTLVRIASSADRLVFIDSTVQDYQQLAAGVSSDSVVVILDPAQDGIQQITRALSEYQNVSSLHIVSHGQSAGVQLGQSFLDFNTLEAYSSSLKQWSDSLTGDADILLYGCDVAAGESGDRFIRSISSLTGADVAASTDITGNAALGGNWILEAKTGSIESDLVFSSELRQNYGSTLASINFSSFASTTGLQLNGSAAQVGSVLRLTPETVSQAGSAFFTTPLAIDGNTSFSTRFQFRLSGGQGTGGADGFVFMLQNSAAGVSSLGGIGGALGYGAERSIAIEFDTYQNGTTETGNNQISLLRNGDPINAVVAVDSSIDLNNGAPINTWIDYNAATDELRVFISSTTTKPTTATLTTTVDLAAIVGNQAYAGFSGGTGGLVNNQDIENWELTTTPGSTPTTGDGLRGEYYDNIDFTNSRFTRVDPTVNFNWGSGSPDSRIAADTFSVRWTGQVLAPTTGTYTFYTTTDDGVRLTVGGQSVINRFQDQAATERSGTISLVAGQRYNINLEYYENRGLASSQLAWSAPGIAKQIIPQAQLFSTTSSPPAGTGTGLRAQYYDNIDFTNPRVSRIDETVNFNWGSGSPDPQIGSDTFSAVWSGQVQPLYSETYTFFTNSDDGVRLFVNGQQIINNFTDHAVTEDRGTITLVAGQKYDIRMEYYERGGLATAQLGWFSTSQARQIIPKSQLFNEITPGTINLGVNSISVNEADGTATIRVDRINGSDGVATVSYTTVRDTALPGSDYGTLGSTAEVTGVVTFAAGETSKNIVIPILNDTTSESTERFGIALGVATGASLGTNRTGIISILDNDAPAEFFFDSNNTYVLENAGTATITVKRGGNTAIAASVQYSTADGTATAGSDYTTVTGTLNFAAGDTEETFTIPILDNSVGEFNETVNLSLSNPVNGTLGGSATSTLRIADSDPGSFTRETLFGGLTQPTAFEWTPGGEYLFVAQKDGIVRVARNGVLQSTFAIDIREQVNRGVDFDRGLLGLTVHPDFFTGNPYVYLLYSYDPPEAANGTGLAGRDGRGNRTARLGKFTASISNGVITLNPASEEVILGKNSKWEFISRPDLNSTLTENFGVPESGKDASGNYIQDFLIADADSHTIGTVKFGTDGYLYVGNGDGASYFGADPRAARTLELNNLSGKILRIDPLTGNAPSDNPFYDGNPQSNQSKVWNLGLRNPFRFAINKQNGQVYMGDVGWTKWEEVNTGRGVNFGWPAFEGGDNGNLRTGGYAGIPAVQNFYNSNRPVTAPIYAFEHYGTGGNAIVMGDFYTGTTFPTEYQNALFISDVSKGTVDALTLDASGNVLGARRFASNQFGIVQISTGPDGNLYYVNYNTGEIGRWRSGTGPASSRTPGSTNPPDPEDSFLNEEGL